MKEVIFIENPEKSEKPVEFTHYLSECSGWTNTTSKPNDFNKIIYLGKCQRDGDMFVVYDSEGLILIYKGHLNSGKY